MHPTSHSMPPEILDLFIDELGHGIQQRSCRQALQACSLVSHSFKLRAQHHLFSDIHFTQSPYAPSLVWRILDFNALLFASSANIRRHIRSFKLFLQGDLHSMHTILAMQELTLIMTVLSELRPDIHTIGLLVHDNSPMVNFSHLGIRFQHAFSNLLQNTASLTTLNLQNISGVPWDFLYGTDTKNICFRRISFADDLPLPKLPKLCAYSRLETMVIDPSFPLETFIRYDRQDVDHPTSLSSVGELKYSLCPLNDVQAHLHPLVDAFPDVEILKLEFLNSAPNTNFSTQVNWRIPYHKLPNMHTLDVSLNGLIRSDRAESLTQLCTLLLPKTVPKSLTRLALEIPISIIHPNWKTKEDFFPDENAWLALDRLLNDERLSGLHNITVNVRYHVRGDQTYTFNEALFVRRCRDLSRQVFSSFNASKSQHFKLSIEPYFDLKDMDNNIRVP